MRRPSSFLLATAVAASMLGPAAPAPAGTGPGIAMYRGLGAWVDIFETGAWKDPAAAVRTMRRHGVRTLYLETSNYSRNTAFVHPRGIDRFLHVAHRNGMRVVAWYLPGFDDLDRDFRRSRAAIRHRTSRGERFDSFALDIESSLVTPPAERSRRLIRLSARLRNAVGDRYPLGAIIPSPRGMELSPNYWPGFPYRALARRYDVFLPMAYYTYRVDGAAKVHRYVTQNIRILRRETGNPQIKIHLIGGLAGASDGAESRELVRAVREHGILGASIYNYSQTGREDWRHLAGVPTNPRQSPALPVRLGFTDPLGNVPEMDRTHPKEVFFQLSGRPGDHMLEFEAFDVQSGEVGVWVNWRKVADVTPTAVGQWGPTQSVVVPDDRLLDTKRNHIHFVARGDHPDWSRWGVRGVALHQVP
jgi:hypothetical protein